MKLDEHAMADAILDTVSNFLDTCPEVEDAQADLTFFPKYDSPDRGRSMMVTIDGVDLVVSVKRAEG